VALERARELRHNAMKCVTRYIKIVGALQHIAAREKLAHPFDAYEVS